MQRILATKTPVASAVKGASASWSASAAFYGGGRRALPLRVPARAPLPSPCEAFPEAWVLEEGDHPRKALLSRARAAESGIALASARESCRGWGWELGWRHFSFFALPK